MTHPRRRARGAAAARPVRYAAVAALILPCTDRPLVRIIRATNYNMSLLCECVSVSYLYILWIDDEYTYDYIVIYPYLEALS